MDVAAINGYVQVAQVLIGAGLATWEQIRDFIRRVRPEVTDAELDAVIQGVIADAQRRKALAESDLAALQSAAPPEQG